MKSKICPIPIRWNDVYEELKREYKKKRLERKCDANSFFSERDNMMRNEIDIPIPLILGGWWGSTDQDKINRWSDTVEWAKKNGLSEIIEKLEDNDFYYSDL